RRHRWPPPAPWTLRRRHHRSLPGNWPPASSAPTTSVAWSAAN
ncbi:hypothetical protein SM139_3008, partial [Stenotrophomonas maltophilia]